MRLKGTCWIAVQDIGGFTPLSESLAKKGKAGTEKLTSILRGFFKDAETEIAAHKGQIFKLAGDAFYALFPGSIGNKEITRLGKKLLNLPTLEAAGLKTRFVAVRGIVECEWFNLGYDNYDLAVMGPAVYDLSLLEEKTPAGTLRTIETGRDGIITRLPRSPAGRKRVAFMPSHRPLYILFLQIPLDFKALADVSHYINNRWGELKLLKWLPTSRNFKGLLIGGFPASTGKEAELIIDFYDDLKRRFPALRFKMGMSSGMVYAGELGSKKFREFAVIGDRVNVAARLVEVAPDMALYFSGEISRSLKGKYKISQIGATRLKGKTEPVVVCQPVEKILDLFEDSLFPHRLVGRKKILSRMLAHIRHRRSCCIVGEAGMGKSRTLYEIIKILGRKDLIKIGLAPVSPPLTLLRELIRHFPAGDFAELNNYIAGRLKLPSARVVELLGAMLRSRANLMIVVEDLHWIDDASLTFLSEIKPFPFLLIASSRPNAGKIIDALDLKAVPLAALDRPALRALATDILAVIPALPLLKLLVDKSAGNPFYLEQIIYDLRERNLITLTKNIARLDRQTETMPFGIHSIILSRFARLPIPVQKTLAIAACFGREFEPRILGKIARHGAPHLDRGIKEGILALSGEIYLFKHALFREAILSSMLEKIRKQHEGKIGHVFIDERKPAYEIAYHLTEGGKIGDAAPYWYNTFKELYDRGLESEITGLIQRLASSNDLRTRPLADLVNGYYLTFTSNYHDAEVLFNQLQENKSLKKLALLGLCALYDWQCEYGKMGKILAALEKYKMPIVEKIEYLELRGIYYDMMGDNKKGLNCYRQTLALSRRHKLDKALISSLHNIGWIYLKQYDFVKPRKYFNQALMLVREGEFFNEGVILLRLGEIENNVGNVAVARNYLERSLKDFQKVSFPYWEKIAQEDLINNYVLSGNKAAAYRSAIKTDVLLNALKRKPRMKLLLDLYYRKFEKFASTIHGKEKEEYELYYLYLYALGKPDAAEDFLAKNRFKVDAPSAELLRKKFVPLDFVSLYKKFVLPRKKN
jgi:class 3 adenylate cyclase